MRIQRNQRQQSRQSPVGALKGSGRAARCGYTLVELLVSISIIIIVVSVGTLTFHRATRSNVLAQARNAVVTYAKVARSYAMANHIETMLVVNPFNGRFEMWHLNPPPHGGAWDPLSGTAPDGYAYAPVLDGSARLPTDGDGRPVAAVHPIDYFEGNYPSGTYLRPVTNDPQGRNLDNLTWTALCFDENGQLVVRTRRIATRTYHYRDGTVRPEAERNRLLDESPDLSLPTLVDARDTPITSTLGLVISDLPSMRLKFGGNVLDPQELVDQWLVLTRQGEKYEHLAETVILNRFSGQRLLGAS